MFKCFVSGERLGMVEAQCERLRMLYRDCARPPPPPLQTDRRQVVFSHLFFFYDFFNNLIFLYNKATQVFPWTGFP